MDAGMVGASVVELVGAGPGDPGLLTRRAARLLTEADVVVADRTSMADIVALAPDGAETHYVGRTTERPARTTAEIVDLLAEVARDGRRVVRLKSGDPFVCSRGAEEMAGLAELGIGCRVTPGVTSATAGPLAAGLPRGRTVTIVSGDDDPVAAPVPWADRADDDSSLVVLIGRAHQGPIARQLIDAGRLPTTSATVIHAAGRHGTRVVRTTLAELGDTRLPPPALFVVGPHRNGGDRAHP